MLSILLAPLDVLAAWHVARHADPSVVLIVCALLWLAGSRFAALVGLLVYCTLRNDRLEKRQS